MKRIPAIASAVLISVGSTRAIAQPAPPPPPPAGPYEAVPPPPGARYVWVPGHWHWNGVRYVWIHGRYVIREAHWGHWVPGRWAWRPGMGRWVWVPAHWAR
jgi:hypothetical protein